MSDQDFILVDEDDKEKSNGGQNENPEKEKRQEVVSTEEKTKDDEDDSSYEKICFICHRPESVTGKMIDLPNNITVCQDCMQ